MQQCTLENLLSSALRYAWKQSYAPVPGVAVTLLPSALFSGPSLHTMIQCTKILSSDNAAWHIKLLLYAICVCSRRLLHFTYLAAQRWRKRIWKLVLFSSIWRRYALKHVVVHATDQSVVFLLDSQGWCECEKESFPRGDVRRHTQFQPYLTFSVLFDRHWFWGVWWLLLIKLLAGTFWLVYGQYFSFPWPFSEEFLIV